MNLREFWVNYKNDRLGILGLIILGTEILMAVFSPYITPYDPSSLHSVLTPPDTAHLMGTDYIGRDLFSNVIYAIRVTLLFAIGAAGLALTIGTFLGAISGYVGGIVDDLFSRFTEIFLSIPYLFLIIIVVALMGNNIIYLTIIIGMTWWPSNARIMRAQVLSMKSRKFVKAAIASGANSSEILMRHILPNAIYPVIVNSTLQMANAILFEAGLSFLGLSDPNYPTWGWILNKALNYKWAWWMIAYPGIFIFISVLAFNFIGTAVNKSLNPRLRLEKC